MTAPDDLVSRLNDIDKRGNNSTHFCGPTLSEAAAELTRLQARVNGYQASRDYAIDLLAAALAIDADKMRAVEYYARLAAERVAALEPQINALRADAERFVFWFGTGLLASQTLDWYRERVDAARKEGK